MVNRPAESPTAKNSYTKKEIEFFQELINKNTPLTKEELGELKKIINRVNPLTTENIKYLLDRIGNAININIPTREGNKTIKITAFDFNIVELFSLFQDSDIENFLKKNISTEQTISDFKDRFKESIDFLKNTPILKNIGEDIVATNLEKTLNTMGSNVENIHNMQDVINFVKSFNKDPSHTEIKDPSYKEIKSLLLKIMFSIIDYRNNDVTTNQSLLNEIIQIFTIKRGKNSIIENIKLNNDEEYFSGSALKKMIKFIANYRGKSKQSRILKALCDPKYGIIKTSGDDIGITFNIDGEFKNLITFIKLIIRFIRNHNNRKNSKILSISEIGVKGFENNKVHTVLRKSPFNIFTITTDIKNVSGDLNEIKLNLRYDGSGVEIKFHLSDNENEIGIQDHRLYKLHTRILGLTIRFGNRKIITESKYRKKAKEVINKIFTEDTKSKYKLLQDLSKYGLPPQGATIDEVVEALLSRYKSNNITLENYQITNLHGLISGSLELPEVNLQVSKTVEEIDNVMQGKPA